MIAAEIGTHRLPIEVATLETGRLFAETVALISETETQYDIAIKRFHPEQADIDAYAEQVWPERLLRERRGPPRLLRRAQGEAAGTGAFRRCRLDHRSSPWPVGQSCRDALCRIRCRTPSPEDQSAGRLGHRGIRAFVEANGVPVNPLHERGYPSIGCEPCTRAIKPGEPERAGRWWWENDETRECGLHVAEEAAVVAQ